jgi:uncharacterized protein (TIGR03083 family)
LGSSEVWAYIHGERVALVQTLDTLTPDQWATPSLCGAWSVQEATGHVVAAAEQTPGNFFKELAMAGFSFDKFADRGAKLVAAAGPNELIRRLSARTTTTNHPPGPTTAMLGEIVVHGEDIRRPLGLTHRPPDGALVTVADAWKKTNILIGGKRRIEGVRLRATDVDWSHGVGPDVSGPMLSLVMAMTGRGTFINDLSGEGVPLLATRS